MPVWERGIPWRQGHVLREDAAKALGLVGNSDPGPTNSVVVVISHDCDLAQGTDAEPEIEIIVGRCVETVAGNYTHAKNARRLHLTFTGGTSALSLELACTGKRGIAKEALSPYRPAEDVRLTPGERMILQRWLAARYRRAALPDAFEHRLRETGLREKITRILKPSSAWISAILLDIDGGEEREHAGPDDPYALAIYLLYATDEDPQKAEQETTVAAKALERAFQDKCLVRNPTHWHHFELVACEPISDEAMSVRMMEHLQQWRTDHLSLRTDPPDPMLQHD